MIATPGRRAAAYWFIDGLPELVFGLAYLSLGLVPAILWHWSVLAAKASLIVLALAFLVLFIWDRRILGWLKARITYPRTGYAGPPGEPESMASLEIESFGGLVTPRDNVTSFRNRAVVVFVLGSNALALLPAPWAPALVMVAVAAMLWGLNQSAGHAYPWWAVLPLAVSGFLFWDIPLSHKAREALPFVLGGLWLTVRGALTLFWYLKENPLPPKELVHD
jgi:hypothetical protein